MVVSKPELLVPAFDGVSDIVREPDFIEEALVCAVLMKVFPEVEKMGEKCCRVFISSLVVVYDEIESAGITKRIVKFTVNGILPKAHVGNEPTA